MRAAKLERAKGTFLRSLEDLRANGEEWAYIGKIARGAAQYDERYGVLRKIAQDFGAHVADQASPGLYLLVGRHTVIDELHQDGVVEARYVESDANPHNGEANPPKQYRLTPVTIPVQAAAEATVPLAQVL